MKIFFIWAVLISLIFLVSCKTAIVEISPNVLDDNKNEILNSDEEIARYPFHCAQTHPLTEL